MTDTAMLYGTTDPMTWAEELAHVIDAGARPDAGLLVGWFANYAHAIALSRRD